MTLQAESLLDDTEKDDRHQDSHDEPDGRTLARLEMLPVVTSLLINLEFVAILGVLLTGHLRLLASGQNKTH